MKTIHIITALCIVFGAESLRGYDFQKFKSQGKRVGKLHEEQRPKNIAALLETKSCPGCDLQTTGKELQNAELQYAKLSDADCTLNDMSGIVLKGADLTKANLNGANLSKSNLENATLTNAILTNANLAGANVVDINLSGANLTGAIWINGQICGEESIGTCMTPDLKKALAQKNCPGCSLVHADLSGKNFQDADLSNADLSNANLTDAYMPGSSLAGANLTRANLTNATLYRADFSNANLTDAIVKNTSFYEANNLGNAILTGVNFSGANLTNANMQNANLAGKNFQGANMQGVHLEGANLIGINATGANLTDAHLEGAHLEGAILDGTTLVHATWTSGAICSQKSIGACKVLPSNAKGGYWDREYNEDNEEWYSWTEVRPPSVYVGTCWPGSLLHRTDACNDWCGEGNYINEECSENKTYCKCKESITPGSRIYNKFVSAAQTVGQGIASAAQTVYKKTGLEWLADHINDAIIKPARNAAHKIAAILYKLADKLATAGDMIRLKTAQIIGAPTPTQQEHMQKFMSFIESNLEATDSPEDIEKAKDEITAAKNAQPLSQKLQTQGVEKIEAKIAQIRTTLNTVQKQREAVIALNLPGKKIKELRQLNADLLDAFNAVEDALNALVSQDCSQGVLCEMQKTFNQAIQKAEQGQKEINEKIQEIDQAVERGNIAGKSTPERLRDSANILNQ